MLRISGLICLLLPFSASGSSKKCLGGDVWLSPTDVAAIAVTCEGNGSDVAVQWHVVATPPSSGIVIQFQPLDMDSFDVLNVVHACKQNHDQLQLFDVACS